MNKSFSVFEDIREFIAMHFSIQDLHEHAYHLISAIAGTIAGAAALIGLLILIYRRASVRRVAVTTSYVDLLAYSLLLFVIVLGVVATVFHNALGAGNGYDYRETVAIGSAACSRSRTTPD